MAETSKITNEKNMQTFAPTGTGVQCPFDSIGEPGAYICNWSGHLLRVPKDAIAAGRSPVVNMVGPDALYVTKISNDPYVTRTKARLISANFDLEVNF
jgi:hypothetical protein